MKEILAVKNLEKLYKNGITIGEVSFTLYEREFVALVGESGSGKSTIAQLLMGLLQKSRGEIYLQGKKREEMSDDEKKQWKQRIQMIFQNPYSSLNPKFTVRQILSEGILAQKILSKEDDLEKYLIVLLEEVGLGRVFLDRYPKELSGGQCQRVGIARALSVKPDILIADECLSALDMLTQYQILDCLEKIKKERKISCLFITHDLLVVKKICDRILIMKEGKIIEQGKKEEIFRNPQQEYTKLLIESSFYNFFRKNHI